MADDRLIPAALTGLPHPNLRPARKRRINAMSVVGVRPFVSVTTVNNRSPSSVLTSKGVAYEAKTTLTSRRDFLQRVAAGVCGTAYLTPHATKATPQPTTSGTERNPLRTIKTGSDVGSLFPFIQSRAVKSAFSLSFLNPRF